MPLDTGNLFHTSISRAQYETLAETETPIPNVR